MIRRTSLFALSATLILAVQAGCSSSDPNSSGTGPASAGAATSVAGFGASGGPGAAGASNAAAGASASGGTNTSGGASASGGQSGAVNGSSGAGGNSSAGSSGSSGSSSTTGGEPGSSGASAGGMSGASSGGGGGAGGTAACGCNGKSGCAVWDKVLMTWYGFNDNSCATEAQHGCNDIADPGLGPKKHQGATEGTGTYDDPITAAASDSSDSGHQYEASGGATLTPGTLIYNPEVKKYFIMEDSCLECGDEYACKLSADDTDDPNPPAGCAKNTYLHIDFWMGPSFAQDSADLENCEDNSTIGDTYNGTGTVIVNPPDNLPVVTTTLYTGTGTGGGCWTKNGVGSDTCQ
jgi:hypothetical protein